MRAASLLNVHSSMRTLVQWMHDNGYEQLNQLTREGQRAFMRDVKGRKGRRQGAVTVSIRTQAQYDSLLRLLFLQGKRYRELAIGEAAPQDAIRVLKQNDDTGEYPRTPEPVAIALIAGAMQLLGPPAEDIIEARDRLRELYEEAKVTRGGSRASQYVRRRLKAKPLAWGRSRNEKWYDEIQDEIMDVARLTRRLCDAVFVVLSYLVGMRVSEILALEAGCIAKRLSLAGDETFTFVTGTIYKTAPTDDGMAHEWAAPPIAERAVDVLERISAPLREESGSENLWLTQRGRTVYSRKSAITVLKSTHIPTRLNDGLARLIGLPKHDGKPWRLSTHQGRKTFAYLVAKQDRSGLHALQSQLGHRSIVMTDLAYSGHDHEMRNLIGDAAMDEMAQAFAEVLTATELAGKGGEEIVRRSPFRGRLVTHDMLEYARQRLVQTGQRFDVCDYGYCYYNARHAACQGDEHGPNHALRTQSICVQCKNFVVAPKHLPVWEERRRSYEVVLKHTPMDRETESALRGKVTECEEVIQGLEKEANTQ